MKPRDEIPNKEQGLLKWVGFSIDTASAQCLSDYNILGVMELGNLSQHK